MVKYPDSIKKSIYHFKDKYDSFKPIYVHKYMKDFGSTGRKSYIIYRKSGNPNSKPFYGRMYRKSEIKHGVNKKYSKKKRRRRSTSRIIRTRRTRRTKKAI